MKLFSAKAALRTGTTLATFALVLALGVSAMESLVLIPADITTDGIYHPGVPFGPALTLGGIIGALAFGLSQAVNDILFGSLLPTLCAHDDDK